MERTKLRDAIEWYFEKPGGNVLTANNLRRMKDVRTFCSDFVTFFITTEMSNVNIYNLESIVGTMEALMLAEIKK